MLKQIILHQDSELPSQPQDISCIGPASDPARQKGRYGDINEEGGACQYLTYAVISREERLMSPFLINGMC
jgi:hypothetical protein